MMLSGTRVRIALAALAMVPLAAGCAALETGGTSSASCVFAVDYGDRLYISAGKVDYTLGSEVGTARDSICDDTGGGEEDQVPVEDPTVYAAYAVKGVDTEDAIAVRESPGDEVHVLVNAMEDEDLKAAVERVFGKEERAGKGDDDRANEPGEGGDAGDGGGNAVALDEAPDVDADADAGSDDSGDSGSGESPSKCVLVVEYGKDSYSDRGDVGFELGAKAGKARAVPCGDTPGEVDAAAEPTVFEAYAIKGLDPADAIAIRFSADGEPFFMVRMADDLPPEVEEPLPAEER